MFKQTIIPLVEQKQGLLNLTETNMILNGILKITGFPNPTFPNKLLKNQMSYLRYATNIELYGLLDLALEANLDSSNKLDETSILVINSILEEVCYRL